MYKEINNFLNLENTAIFYKFQTKSEIDNINKILNQSKLKTLFYNDNYYNNFLALVKKAESEKQKFKIQNFENFTIIYLFDYVFIYCHLLDLLEYYSNTAQPKDEHKTAITKTIELIQYKNGRSKAEITNKLKHIKNIIVTEIKKEVSAVATVTNKYLNTKFYIYLNESEAEEQEKETKKVISEMEQNGEFNNLIYNYLIEV